MGHMSLDSFKPHKKGPETQPVPKPLELEESHKTPQQQVVDEISGIHTELIKRTEAILDSGAPEMELGVGHSVTENIQSSEYLNNEPLPPEVSQALRNTLEELNVPRI